MGIGLAGCGRVAQTPQDVVPLGSSCARALAIETRCEPVSDLSLRLQQEQARAAVRDVR